MFCYTTIYSTLHYSALLCTLYTTLHYTTLLYYTTLHYTTPHEPTNTAAHRENLLNKVASVTKEGKYESWIPDNDIRFSAYIGRASLISGNHSITDRECSGARGRSSRFGGNQCIHLSICTSNCSEICSAAKAVRVILLSVVSFELSLTPTIVPMGKRSFH